MDRFERAHCLNEGILPAKRLKLCFATQLILARSHYQFQHAMSHSHIVLTMHGFSVYRSNSFQDKHSIEDWIDQKAYPRLSRLQIPQYSNGSSAWPFISCLGLSSTIAVAMAHDRRFTANLEVVIRCQKEKGLVNQMAALDWLIRYDHAWSHSSPYLCNASLYTSAKPYY